MKKCNDILITLYLKRKMLFNIFSILKAFIVSHMKVIVKIILILILGVIIVMGLKNVLKFDNSDVNYHQKFDSLEKVVYQKDIELLQNKIKRDSINQVRTIKNIYYDTQIKNYSNPDIVGNDSISRYISEKIHNR